MLATMLLIVLDGSGYQPGQNSWWARPNGWWQGQDGWWPGQNARWLRRCRWWLGCESERWGCAG